MPRLHKTCTSRADPVVDLRHGGLLAVVPGVDVGAHRGAVIRVSHEALDGLDVGAGIIQYGSQRVAEYVAGGAVQVDGGVDAPPHVVV